MPIVNYMVMCTSVFIRRIDLMLSVFIRHTENNQRDTGNLGGVDMTVTLIVVMVLYLHMSKLIKFHTLNICRFCISIMPQQDC